MNSLTGFFKSSNSRTSSSGTGPDFTPPIGEYYAYIETSSPNYGPDRYAIAKYSYHEIITKIKFWYHRLGINMCRFRLQYETLDYQWVDKVTFLAKEQTCGWVFLEETFSEDNRGIRFFLMKFQIMRVIWHFVILLLIIILLNNIHPHSMIKL